MAVKCWSIYYAKNHVLIPTIVETFAGVNRLVDPMDVVDVNNQTELKHSILATIDKGNPLVPHPSREEMNEPITLHKKLGFKSYKAFNHNALTWAIISIDGIYEIKFSQVPESGRGYVPDPSKTITFPSGTPIETVVDKLIEIIQETHRQKMIEGNKE